MTDTAEKRARTIVGLHASNFKKITVVDINTAAKTANGEPAAVVTVGGQNEAGKSTVLDAIAVVLGGKALAPKVPIRMGQTSATIVADLGDLKVTRTFQKSEDGAVTSGLVITNADGSAEYKSPQSLLDRLLGGNTFHDPLRFDRLKPADRRAEVARLVGLDFTVLDAQRATAVTKRTEAKRTTDRLGAELARLGEPDADAPLEEVDVAEQLKVIEVADNAREHANEVADHVKKADGNVQRATEVVDHARTTIEDVEQKIAELKERSIQLVAQLTEDQRNLANAEKNADTARRLLEAAREAIPDDAPAREAIKNAKATNERVRRNALIAKVGDEVETWQNAVARADEQVKTLDQQKQDQLAAAPFPVTGMAFADDDVVLDGLPFEQASTARRLRASVAMALHNAGEIKVLLVKAGNDLDAKNLALLAEVAAEHGAQVWVERVADDPKDVTVYIEDGAVRA